MLSIRPWDATLIALLWLPRPGAGASVAAFGGEVSAILASQPGLFLTTSSHRGGGLDLPLEDLSGRPLRQVVEEPDEPRVLVSGDAILDVGADLLRAQLLALDQDDRGTDLLSPLVVGHSEDRRFADLRVLVENLLDLTRVDVVAAADDQVLLAVDDVEVAVLVDAGHVAGVEPAAAHRLLGRAGGRPVALHDGVGG